MRALFVVLSILSLCTWAFSEKAFPYSLVRKASSFYVMYPNEDVPAGYISSIDQDIPSPTTDLVVVKAPQGYASDDASSTIFTQQLSKEFTERYEDKFGRTPIEQSLELSKGPNEYGSNLSTTTEAQESQSKQKEFGEYMFRRLSEYHVDTFFRSDPKLKSVWELKEKVSNVSVEVRPGMKLNTNYSFSGNFVTATFENPYINARSRWEMSTSSFGPGPIEETIVSLYRNITPQLALENYYRVNSETASIVTRYQWRPNLQSTVTVSNTAKATASQVQETTGLVGLLYVY